MEQVKGDLKNLFQQEFTKMVAVISNSFGLEHIEMAEDLVSETFLQAAETWGIKGIPANPAAWLYAVAKQKTLYYLRRNKRLGIKSVEIIPELQEPTLEFIELDFSTQNIKDSQLAMIFAICTSAIASEAQVGLALRILCGFSIDEIAEAFFTNKETINKRLYRAKEKLRSENVTLVLPSETEISNRLDNVLHIIYLLFSEGYYSRTQNKILRKELCREGLQLGLLLTNYEKTNLPKTNALVALMCFHASRFNARQTENGYFIPYAQQNEKLWDVELFNQGVHYLDYAAQGNEMSSYHIEAQIAYWHCLKVDTKEKWEAILKLYTQLLLVNYSPAVALNRIFALYKVEGWELALIEAEKLNPGNNHFYFSLLGELYQNSDLEKARESFLRSYALAKTQTERTAIQEKIRKLPPVVKQ
ncbi:RNA polymerase subunit sigma [Pedobacter sp. HMWF019]|uniref:RNA polymerase sigma factor n=1 Tax=Pedobacter sp. HMWF019 TaxID=2056856 RepID=UPI000D3A20DB|nr:sigma-70 family RNA polymerase sigma factor [Pedobacter sp. HMWF019]PTS98546.1 RNA polymerase subunit sigma [Pedobacter sp. HMWF019]